MISSRPICPRLSALAAALLLSLFCAVPSLAQGIDPEGRLIRDVTFQGLSNTPEQLVRNAIRTEAGKPYQANQIKQDIVNLTFLGRFDTVQAKVQDNGDGSINVVFEVIEQPTLRSLSFTGNKRLNEEQLTTQVLLTAGDPIDKSLIDRGVRAIQKAYAEKGHFAASVTYDEQALKDKGQLNYTIVEGPRVRVTEFRFEGNSVFDNDTLESRVSSETYYWPFIAGFMDRTKLDVDVASIREYYFDRGYLNAQVGRRIDLSPRQNRAVVTFEISEGQQHTVRDIQVRFFAGDLNSNERVQTEDQLMSQDQIRMVIDLVRGGVYADERLESSQEAVTLWYGEIGFINTQVRINRVFDPDKPEVDVVVDISEGIGPTIVDDVIVIGLTRTQQKVLLRRVRLEPGRPANLRALKQTQSLVEQSIWFSGGTTTWLGDPDDPARSLLIEANEKNTGSFSIGAGLSSDIGIFGAISLTQRNFDATDWPESVDEFLAQRAFLGAGQTFNVTLAPGNDNSRYAIGFNEPYLFESDYFFDLNLSAFQSTREDFDEGRLGIRTGVGRRLGDIWSGSVRLRAEQVSIDDIEPLAPVDVFAVAGDSTITSLGLNLVRSTTDSNIEPSRGSRITLGVDQFGSLGGDYDFTRFSASYDQFWTLEEDFLGRKSILSLQVDTGYIPQNTGDVPLFERFYSGGRDFRGFAFRGVGPRGLVDPDKILGNGDDFIGVEPVGGRFEFVTRLQYDFPVYDKFVRWAVFTDQGTIQDDVGFDQWRVAVGTGIRLKLPFFGQAPIAVDFGFPIVEEEGDDSQIISFSIDLPFN